MTKRSLLTQIYSHRGYAGLYPESTLIGYEASLNLGVDSLDIDVAITKDNIIVASHDRFLNKDFTRDGNKKWLINNGFFIANFNYKELKNFDVGTVKPNSLYHFLFPNQTKLDNITIPSLEEIIHLTQEYNNKLKKHHKIQIEIKTEPTDTQQYIERFVDAIIQVLKNTNFVEYTELQSFDWRTLIYAKKILPQIHTSFITQQNLKFDSFTEDWTAGYSLKDYNNSIPYLISQLGGYAWCPDYKDLDLKLINEAHSYDLKVIPWTVDNPESMLELLNWNIDGIITNYPNILKQLLTT